MTPPEAQAMPDSVFLQKWLIKPNGAVRYGFSFEPEQGEQNTEYLKKSTITAQLKAGDELAEALKNAKALIFVQDEITSLWLKEADKALSAYASVRGEKP